MILQVQSNLDKCDACFEVTVGNETKTIDSIDSKIHFDVEIGTYVVNIKKVNKEINSKFLSIFLFLITMIFRGILNILFLNIESVSYLELDPFCTSAKVKIDINNDTQMKIYYSPSKFDHKKNIWTHPNVEVYPLTNVEVHCVADTGCFDKRYKDFVKNVISVIVIASIVFSFFLYQSIVLKKTVLCLFLFLTIVLILLIGLFVMKKQYKDMTLYKTQFENQTNTLE